MKWDLTALQLAVLYQLMNGELSGRELRTRLRKHGIKRDGPAFYMMMSRLVEAKLVNQLDGEKVAGGHRVKERRYDLTGEGQRTLDSIQTFQGLAMEGV